MNALYGIGILASVIHGIIYDGTYWKIYGVLFLVYLVFVMVTRDMRDNPKRRTIMAATWNGKLKFLLIL
jgi:cell shape-determining protein MreD